MGIEPLSILSPVFEGNEAAYLQECIRTNMVSSIDPLALMEGLPEHFLVINADVITNMNFGGFLNYHRNQNAAVTMATIIKEVHLDYGVLECEENRLVSFNEKPTFSYRINMGIYGFTKQAIRGLKTNQFCQLNDFVNQLLEQHEKINVYSHSGFWIDIGSKKDYDYVERHQEKLYDLLEL